MRDKLEDREREKSGSINHVGKLNAIFHSLIIFITITVLLLRPLDMIMT